MHITSANPYEPSNIRQLVVAGTKSPVVEKTVEQGKTAANSAPRPVNSTEAQMSQDMTSVLLEAQEASTKPSQSPPIMDTGNGKAAIDLDKMYANERPKTDQKIDLADIPLLIPSAQNIATLREHASQRFKQLLADYNIPEAPSSISYDQHGQMQLPEDYPYAEELKQALAENPGLDREMHDLNALSSHFAAMQQLQPLHQELAAAKNQQQIDQVIEKYSYLLHDNVQYRSISFQLSEDGNININADDKPLVLA